VRSVDQRPNLRHLCEPQGGTEGPVTAVGFKKTTESMWWSTSANVGPWKARAPSILALGLFQSRAANNVLQINTYLPISRIFCPRTRFIAPQITKHVSGGGFAKTPVSGGAYDYDTPSVLLDGSHRHLDMTRSPINIFRKSAPM